MKVIITIKRLTEYASIVEMTPEKYERLQEQINGPVRNRNSGHEELNKLIDVKDWQSDEFSSLESFEPLPPE